MPGYTALLAKINGYYLWWPLNVPYRIGIMQDEHQEGWHVCLRDHQGDMYALTSLHLTEAEAIVKRDVILDALRGPGVLDVDLS